MNSKSVKEGGKHNMYSKSKRFIASFLAVLMAVCMLPVDMFGVAGVAYAATDDITASPATADETFVEGTSKEVTLTLASGTGTIYYVKETGSNGDVYNAIDDGVTQDSSDGAQEATNNKITLSETTTFKAFTISSETDPSDENKTINKYANVSEFTYTFSAAEQQVEAISATTSDGTAVSTGATVAKGTVIKLATNTAGAEIYYTTDGETPDNTKTAYTDAGIELNTEGSVTIKAVAVKSGMTDSDVLTLALTVNGSVEKEGVYKLVFNEEFDAPSSSSNVTAGTYGTKKADGTTGYFSLGQGSSGNSGQICNVGNTPLVLPENNKLGETEYIGAAFQSGGAGSPSSNPKRTIQFTTQKAAKLTIGAYNSSTDTDRTIYLSKGTAKQNDTEKTILSDPSEWSFNIDEGEWSICFTKSLRILYVFVEEVDVIPPAATPAAGIVSENQAVTLSAAEGAVIYYTVDESEPTTGSNVYDSAINITTTPTIIKAIAVKDGKTSEVQTYEYKFQVAKPEADVPAGVVTVTEPETAKTLKVTTSTAGAEIYYTIDGTTPSKENGTLITSDGITIDNTMTFKAIAVKDGYADSDVLTRVYIVPTTGKIVYTADSQGSVDPYFTLINGSKQTIASIASNGTPIYSGLDDWTAFDVSETPYTESIAFTSGNMSLNKAPTNCIMFTTSASETKVVVYYSPKGSGGELTIASVEDGTVANTATDTDNAGTTAKIAKAEFTLSAAGTYCVGITGSSPGGGIIPYMVVTENPNATPAGDKVTLTFTDGDSTTTKEVAKGEEYTFTDADKLEDTDDKVFLGWATADAPTVVVPSITPDADTILYAVWADKYVVTLEQGDANESTFTGFPAKVAPGAKVTLPPATNADTTKVFLGWRDKANADATPIPAGEYEPTGTITLVPVFAGEDDIFTVTRNYGYAGADNTSFPVTKGADGKATVTLAQLGTPTRNDGYTFDKWVVYENETEGEAVTADAGVEIDKNTTFLAKWTKNPDMYTVTFKDADGNTVTTTPAIDAQVPEDTEITLPATTNTKDDYDFEGWKVNGEGSVLSVGATYKVEGNVTFVESWKAKEEPDTPPTPSDIPTNEKLYVRFVDAEGDEVDPDDEYIYTGAKVEPKVEVYNYGRLLTVGTDYTVKYKNNVNAGTNASLTVSGKGNFSGAANVITFTIKPASIASVAYPESMTVAVNTKVAPAIMHGTKKLANNKDFTLEGEELDAKGKYATAGDYTLTVKGKGNYDESSSATIYVKVVEKSAVKKLNVKVDTKTKLNYGEFSVESISDLVVKPAADSGEDEATTQAEGDESGVAPIITVADKSGTVLTEDKDFVIYTASSLNDAGTVKFTVVGMGDYSGTVNKSFKINPAKITSSGKFKVEFDEKDYEFKASGVTVDNLTVRYLGDAATQAEGDEGVLLTEGVDYKVAYSNNKKVSTDTKQAQIKINFLGNYKGSKVDPVKFNIVTAKLDAGEDGNTVVVVPEKVYGKDGKAYKSTPIVMVDGVAIKASNYDVHYAWRAESAQTYTEDDKVKITLGAEDTYAHVKVTIAPKANASYAAATAGDTPVAIEGEYYVVKQGENAIDLSTAKVVFTDKSGNVKKALDYNGKPFYTPDADGTDTHDDEEADDPNAVYVKVTVKNVEVSSELYSVKWTNATEKGKATVVVTGTWEKDDDGNSAVGSKNASISIKPMKIAKTALPSNKKPVVAGAFKDALDKLF
ncbi:MAG: hypothetical protein HDR03_02300 [Lachnospiraceae bacterium]|nr:hypothetical protein [Lachnospiraceae bacterium]